MLFQIIVWVLQVLLAGFFVFHSVMYVFAPKPLVAGMQGRGQWPPAIPVWFRRFIGVAELLAAVALVGPGVVRVLFWLTPLAAACLVFVTLSATIYHLRRHEPPAPLPYLVMALAVAYLRWAVIPLS